MVSQKLVILAQTQRVRMSTPSASPGNPPSKLPRFLQKQATRDRSKSESVTVGSSTSSTEPKPRKGSKFLSINKDRKSDVSTDFPVDEPPIIVEPPELASPGAVPIPSPRPRTRSERPAASAPETQHINLYASTGGTRIGDLPTRLSGWFAHTFSTSSTDLSLPTILAQHSGSGSPSGYDSSQSTSSPRKLIGPAALLAAAKHGKGTLDKAMRYLLDSDAVPDRCGDPIWLLGVSHPGWEGPPPDAHPAPAAVQRKIKGRRGSWRSSSSSAASSSADGHSSPATTTSSTGHGASTSSTAGAGKDKGRIPLDPGAAWPPAFYDDFTSRIWLTYRSHLPSPIRDARLAELEPCSPAYGVINASLEDNMSPTNTGRKVWPWAGEKTWSADTGWGCMLRTGQSLLANALVGVLLGRDWRRPPHPVATADYATYVRVLTWFLDTPAPHAPFSVHRMALAGKELGTDVGQWFGPSVAAGAIKTLVSAFPECGLSVALAVDGTLYESTVFAASHGQSQTSSSSRTPGRQHATVWGDRPVLLLLGIRLGIEGVNPIYYETIKMLYTFPQSVGIAGGRPSSSYYFVGSQADSLFYLDPHNPRPAIALKPPPRELGKEEDREMDRDSRRNGPGVSGTAGLGRAGSASVERREEEEEEDRSSPEREAGAGGIGTKMRRRVATPTAGGSVSQGRAPQQQHQQQHQRQYQNQHQQHPQHHHQYYYRTNTPASPSSVKTGSSNFSYHAPTSPSPLQQQFSSSSADSRDSRATRDSRASRSSYAEGDADVDGEGASVGYGDGDADTSVGYADSAGGWGIEDEEDGGRGPPPGYHQYGQHRYAGGGVVRGQGHALSHTGATTSVSAHTSVYSSTTANPNSPPLDPVQLHYCNAYSAAELRTFHCERVRKMPLSGLDPSMLIGFVCRDEEDWRDFRRRVAQLPKTIFSIQEEPPTWPSDLDDDMGLESISEPDDLDLDDEEEEGVEVDAEVDVDEEQFFDTRSGSGSSKSEHRHAREGERARAARRAQRPSTDTSEEDPTDPVTPGPTSRFEIRPPVPRKGKGRAGEDEDEDGEEEEGKRSSYGGEDEDGEGDGANDDIEDDWIDPSVPTPINAPPATPAKEHDPPPPPPAKDKHTAPSSSSKHSSSTTKTKKPRKQVPVPVPIVRVPQQVQPQEHYPFPVTPADEPVGGDARERTRSTSGRKAPARRMHNARARDGGRTQSGGVKGILTED